MAFHSILSLSEPLHSCPPARPPAPVYSFILTPGLCCYKHASFLSARVREYACSGLYSLLGLALGQPNHYLRHFYALILYV